MNNIKNYFLHRIFLSKFFAIILEINLIFSDILKSKDFAELSEEFLNPFIEIFKIPLYVILNINFILNNFTNNNYNYKLL